MTREIEQGMFLKELQRLQEDYVRCENEELRNEIMADIELLSNVITHGEQVISVESERKKEEKERETT
ncbi:hypothetical protein V1502_09760 [Bacillus sp. SCS-153A]|uniref:hypothetical protein n=1 Tax=Rossellomorea sedimentorum TaxID=3115294 RepID=UPI003906A294